MNYSNPILGAGQDIGRAIVAPVTVSLEERVEHLEKAVARLQQLRAKFDDYLEGLCPNGCNQAAGAATPPAAGVSGKLGEQISYIHANIDTLEAIARRFGEVLFSQAPKPARG